MLLWDRQEIITWLNERIPDTSHGFAATLAWESEGKITQAASLFSYNSSSAKCAIAMDPGVVLNRTFIQACLFYAFLQLKLNCLIFEIPSSNLPSQNFARRLGASLEATLQKAAPGGDDLLIFSLYPEACHIWRNFYAKRRQCAPSA